MASPGTQVLVPLCQEEINKAPVGLHPGTFSMTLAKVLHFFKLPFPYL